MKLEPADSHGIKGLDQERAVITVKLSKGFPADRFGRTGYLKFDQQRHLSVDQLQYLFEGRNLLGGAA